MAPSISTPEGFAHIDGRSGERAKRLLEVADELGVSRDLVRTTSFGYVVPTEVAQAYGDAPTAPLVPESSSELDSTETTKTEADGESSTEGETNEAGESEKSEETESEEKQPEPPRAGAGSSTQAWADWATANHGYDQAEELSRDELIAKYGASTTE